ncbi:MAG: TraB/GumN family protein [Candidatus Hodarchaeaceae archaeon]|nr:TraB/GumN family protein [Candidatus Hodarchaeaceae archaeon]
MLRRLNDRLILVGVAHILPESRVEAERAIERERPEVVAVELCRGRYEALAHDLPRPSVLEVLRARRFGLFMLNNLLYLLQNRFARQTGTPAGEEMLAAIECAKRVGARVELIDRDIGITLERLMGRTGMMEKMKFLAEILLGFLPFGPRVKLDKLTEDEVLSHLLSSLKRASPAAYEVLIEERNEYMAARIAELLALSSGRIVCVVGAGHVPGLCQRLTRERRGWHAVSWGYTVAA